MPNSLPLDPRRSIDREFAGEVRILREVLEVATAQLASASCSRLAPARCQCRRLNHWLIARTGEEVVAREVFAQFKRYADDEPSLAMPKLLEQIHHAAGQYRAFITDASTANGPIDRIALFGYRTSVLKSEVVKPLVLCLLDREQSKVPEEKFTKALEVVESWMVRRMLVRASTKSYSQVIAELVALVSRSRATAGDAIEKHLSKHTSASSYWPDDNELQQEVATLQAYRRLGRGRLRMILESIEGQKRGWTNGRSGLGGERVARGKLAIEHVMPRKWHTHWPTDDPYSEKERDGLMHTLGNLTLLTSRLNSRVSNGPWLRTGGKREGLEQHDVLILKREILRTGKDEWTTESIRLRTKNLLQCS